MYTYNEIAGLIDHSLLKPFLTDKDVEEGCRLADTYQIASVCVRPCDVRLARSVLQFSPVRVTSVIGFPHGTTTTHTKLEETKEAVENGVEEIDVVLNIGKMKSGDYEYVKNDLEAVIKYAHENDVKVKVIFENCYLNNSEKKKACEICNELGADWVKTSTGYGTGGAEPDDIKLMRNYSAPGIQLKTAGGIHTLKQVLEMKQLGCTRIGSTATVEILEECKNKTKHKKQ